MRHLTKAVALGAITVSLFTGCRSHQAKVDALQREYDRLARRFHQDCSAEYLKIPPHVSPECSDEEKEVKVAWDRLQTEQAKK